MDQEISAFAAKTHLSEFLRETERGRCFTICRRGRPVARLTPAPKELAAVAEVFASLNAFRKSIKGRFNARKLIELGRRY